MNNNGITPSPDGVRAKLEDNDSFEKDSRDWLRGKIIGNKFTCEIEDIAFNPKDKAKTSGKLFDTIFGDTHVVLAVRPSIRVLTYGMCRVEPGGKTATRTQGFEEAFLYDDHGNQTHNIKSKMVIGTYITQPKNIVPEWLAFLIRHISGETTGGDKLCYFAYPKDKQLHGSIEMTDMIALDAKSDAMMKRQPTMRTIIPQWDTEGLKHLDDHRAKYVSFGPHWDYDREEMVDGEGEFRTAYQGCNKHRYGQETNPIKELRQDRRKMK